MKVEEGKMKHIFCLQGIFSFIYSISNHNSVKGNKDGYILTLHMKKNAVRLNDYPGLSIEKLA